MYFEKKAKDYLQEILKQNNVFSNKEAAKKLEYTEVTISNALNDDTYITVKFLEKFYNVFNVPPVIQNEINIRQSFANLPDYWRNEIEFLKEKCEKYEKEEVDNELIRKVLEYAKDLGLENALKNSKK